MWNSWMSGGSEIRDERKRLLSVMASLAIAGTMLASCSPNLGDGSGANCAPSASRAAAKQQPTRIPHSPIGDRVFSILSHMKEMVPPKQSPDWKDAGKMYGILAAAIDKDAAERGVSSEPEQQALRLTIVLSGDSNPNAASVRGYKAVRDSIMHMPGMAATIAATRQLRDQLNSASQYRHSHQHLADLLSSADSAAALGVMSDVADVTDSQTINADTVAVLANAVATSGAASLSSRPDAVALVDTVSPVLISGRELLENIFERAWIASGETLTPQASLSPCRGLSSNGSVVIGAGTTAFVTAWPGWITQVAGAIMGALRGGGTPAGVALGAVTGYITAGSGNRTQGAIDGAGAAAAGGIISNGLGVSTVKSAADYYAGGFWAQWDALTGILAEYVGP